MKTQAELLLFVLLATALVNPVLADKKGYEIAKKSDTLDNGWKDSTSTLVMILRDRQKREVTRKIRNKTMEVPGDGDKTLIVFDAPRDLKGTKFLSYTHINRPDDQWLYLNSLKRVKRISSNNKSGPFMGSEFAYEDVASQELDKYEYKYLGDEKVNGIDCYKLELTPTYKYSGYNKMIAWYNKKTYRVVKIDYYDRKDALLKTLTFNGYRKYLGKYYRADKMEMVNHQTGKSTVLLYKNYKFGNGFDDSDFDLNALRRAR